jgi:hypothetical protein
VLPFDSNEGAINLHMSSSLRYTIQDFAASQDPILDWLQSIEGLGYGWSNHGGVTSELVVDHFRITKVPEPATWGLFALGLIGALLAHRRRLPSAGARG